MFTESLAKVVKNKGIRAEHVWLAVDCSRDEIWRHSLYNEYKTQRDKTTNHKFNSYIFTYTFDVILPEILAANSYNILSVECAEADDIIGVMKTWLRRDYPEMPVFILTNDRDYVQLCDEYTCIFNLQGKELSYEYSPEIDLHLKIISGDSSDNITSVFCRLTKKKIQSFIDEPETLRLALEADPAAAERYERNRNLIDMSRIPNYILQKMEKIWKKVNVVPI
jgi:5'-3' exonuclease